MKRAQYRTVAMHPRRFDESIWEDRSRTSGLLAAWLSKQGLLVAKRKGTSAQVELCGSRGPLRLVEASAPVAIWMLMLAGPWEVIRATCTEQVARLSGSAFSRS
jgi:hypothetical protein